MTRKLTILGIVVLTLVALFATAGIAFAQEPATPPAAGGPCGAGGSWRWGPSGIKPLVSVADLFGMTTEELYAQLTAGKTVLDVAGEKGFTAEQVVGAIMAPRAERVESAVEEGRITQEQADLMIQTMTDRVTEKLEAGNLGLNSQNRAGQGGRGMGRMGSRGGNGAQGFLDSDGDGICDNLGSQQRGGFGGRWGSASAGQSL